jgi:hypothetical protein
VLPELTEAGKQVPLLLMNARFDGKFGFFGGVVEDSFVPGVRLNGRTV